MRLPVVQQLQQALVVLELAVLAGNQLVELREQEHAGDLEAVDHLELLCEMCQHSLGMLLAHGYACGCRLHLHLSYKHAVNFGP